MEDFSPAEMVALAAMEIHTAPGARITLRPFAWKAEGLTIPGAPFHFVLEQGQARELAKMLVEAADQSAEEATVPRN